MDYYTQEGDSFPHIPSRDWSCLDDLTFLNVFAGSHGRWHGRASVGRSMDSHFLISFQAALPHLQTRPRDHSEVSNGCY